MNRNPNTSGIDRYWKDGDDRRKLAELLSLNSDSNADRNAVDGFLAALLEAIRTRRRTVFVGIGTFSWRPYRKRIPSGKTVETWRLVFRLARNKRERKWK